MRAHHRLCLPLIAMTFACTDLPETTGPAADGLNTGFREAEQRGIEEPGYYRIQAVAQARSPTDADRLRRFVADVAVAETWFLVDENGGAEIGRLTKAVFPDSVVPMPGPIRTKTQRDGVRLRRDVNFSGSGTNCITGRILYAVGTLTFPVEGAWVGGFIGPVLNGNFVQDVADANGWYTVSGSAPGEVFDGQALMEHEDVRVTDIGEIGQINVVFQSGTVQQDVIAWSPWPAKTFTQHVRAIAIAEGLLGHDRSQITVEIDDSSTFYNPSTDKITISEIEIMSSRAIWTAAHEFGHAIRHEVLGGLAPSNPGNVFGTFHEYLGGYTLGCAYQEGFADFVATSSVGDSVPATQHWAVGRVEIDNTGEDWLFQPPPQGGTNATTGDGSLVEAAFSALLFDLVDGPSWPGRVILGTDDDDFEFPGVYVADIVRTCRVQTAGVWHDATGTDHIVWCLQQIVAPEAPFFPTRFTHPTAFTESASEPAGWNATTMTALWQKNLYRTDEVAMIVAIQGPSVIEAGQNGTWTASVSGGQSPFTFQWLRDGVLVSTSSAYSGTRDAGTLFTLELGVIGATGGAASNQLVVTVTGGGGCIVCF